MKTLAAIIVVFSLVFITIPVEALSLQGGSGVITIPAARVQGSNTLGLRYFYQGGQNVFHVQYGYTNQVEFGLTYSPPARWDDVQAHLKAVLLAQQGFWPAIAAGVAHESPYGVLSLALGDMGLSFHGGYGIGDLGGPFLGLEQELSFLTRPLGFDLPSARLQGEYCKGGFNLGLEVETGGGLRVQSALLNFQEAVFGLEYAYTF